MRPTENKRVVILSLSKDEGNTTAAPKQGNRVKE